MPILNPIEIDKVIDFVIIIIISIIKIKIIIIIIITTLNIVTSSHHLEDPVNVLSGSYVVHGGLGTRPYEVVHGSDYFSHLVFGYDSVAIEVVQIESPQQLLLDRPAGQHRQSGHEFLVGIGKGWCMNKRGWKGNKTN